MQAIAAAPLAAKLRLEFVYDYMGRRIQKKVYGWNVGTGTYLLQSTTKFVYDGWNLTAELDGTYSTVRSYLWGQDISDSLQGAGGISGLLMTTEAGTSYVVGYDGSGNVAVLVNTGAGTIAASYEYDSFGNILKATGTYAGKNPFKFSTRYTDSESGLVYFGYRYFNPSMGNWLSRDPMEEEGGLSLYNFVNNNPINVVDRLGLDGLVVAGGTSVHDPDGHDQSAWNFLTAAARRATALVKEYKSKQSDPAYKDAKVYLIMYTPSYERREVADGRPANDFVNQMLGFAQRGGWQLVTIRSAGELTYHFNKSKTGGVTSIDYFGHSSADRIFLEYSSVIPGDTTDAWTGSDALNVRRSIFYVKKETKRINGRRVVVSTPTAVFSSYGCYQGEEGALAKQLHDIWGIITKGSRGKTRYYNIGSEGATFPTSDGGYAIFP
jgi:RHS repeat-associated protein